MWLICVDAYSQFPFVIQMSSTTTANTIAALSSIFGIEGYPNTMVSDNGPQLTADAFEEFCKLHGTKHITTAPFHPASNGLAERFVQTFEFAVKKNLKDGIPLREALFSNLILFLFLVLLNAQQSLPSSRGRTNLHDVFQAYQYAKAAVFARKSIVLSQRTSEKLSI
ncbi:uncharacterized protein K02A2.6-like [Drosophila gunungcola]|uniref:uncharacterized protein K02A2.6-like n=1 Tax=Drosophila gunungcola TaxID=103775 RepID=UPI0022E70FCA|nr:uncharacterized protein K02A2.6-like [Drosophila gunungcola]